MYGTLDYSEFCITYEELDKIRIVEVEKMNYSYQTKKKKEEFCLVCESYKGMGIHVYQSFICLECERAIVQTSTNDPKYQFFIQQLNKGRSVKCYKQA